ncbi:MAG: hypothetical protein AB7I42_25140 [Bradyrhizobium sp.]|uniref:hypothetical protein n=1 Tax=Bradyrhizobium sp. TaxID=376 RepID=UPI003D0B5564
MATDFNHPLVGRVVAYRDPYRDAPEQGPITSVNEEAGLVFVRYGHGSTSAATAADDRLTFLDGSPVSDALGKAS